MVRRLIPRAMEFSTRLEQDAAAVEAVLKRLLATDAGWSDQLAKAMRYAVLGGGKRLRPFVAIESARLFEAKGDGVLRAAAALECVHCYSLVHDDLPAMDDDDLRRGRPSVHRAFGESTAILVGDALLTLAFEILADPATHADAEIRTALGAGLARAAGAGGMAGGQALDLAGEGVELGKAAIARLQAMKTSALFQFAAEAGALIAGAGKADRDRLSDFGAKLGAVFQLADDLLDHSGSQTALGKATRRDAARKKPTLVALLGESRARALLAGRIAAAEAELTPYGERGAVLAEAARFVGGRV